MAKNPLEKFASEKGELSWLFIDGEGKDNYNEDGKIYSGMVSLEGKSMERDLDRIKDFWEENKPEEIEDPDSFGFSVKGKTDEDKTDIEGLSMDEVIKEAKKVGRINIVFSTGTTYPNGKTKTIETFNAKGVKVQLNGRRAGNGSEGCLLGSMAIWERGKKGSKGHEAGVTFFLDGVQLTKFVEYSAIAEMDEHEGWTGDEPEGLGSEEAEVEEPKKSKKGKPRL